MKLSLKQKTISGVKWTTTSTFIVTLLQLLQLAVLARFLDPSAFGLMALVMVVIGFSQVFLDMGINNAIIYQQNITHEQLSSLYWVNILSGFGLFGIISLLAPFIAEFFKEPKLTELIIIVGITFLIQPFGQQFMILWQKEMRFSEIAKIDIVNKAISFVVSVYLASKGYGVYALVYGVLAGVASQTLQFMYIGLKEHKPSFIFRASEIKEFLSFGLYHMGDKTINYFNSQVDMILVGKLLGTELLGIYSISKQLIMKPTQIINPIIVKVMFPTMAKLQNDNKRLKNIYLKTINYLLSIIFPIYAFLLILAPELVVVMFGKNWIAAVPIVQVLALYGAIRSIGSPVGSLILAKGKVKFGFWWNLLLLFYVPFMIYISSQWGIMGISWGMAIALLSIIIPQWYFIVRPLCGARFLEYYKEILTPMIIVVTSGSLVYILINDLEIIMLKFIFSILIGSILIIVLNYFLNRQFLTELRGFIK